MTNKEVKGNELSTVETIEERLLMELVNKYKEIEATVERTSVSYSLQCGKILAEIKDKKLYTAGGFKGVGDLATKLLGVSAGTASDSIKVYKKYGERVLTGEIYYPYKLLVAASKMSEEDESKAFALYDSGMSANMVLKTVADGKKKLLEDKKKEAAKKEAENPLNIAEKERKDRIEAYAGELRKDNNTTPEGWEKFKKSAENASYTITEIPDWTTAILINEVVRRYPGTTVIVGKGTKEQDEKTIALLKVLKEAKPNDFDKALKELEDSIGNKTKERN